jgi:SET domain-containing protein
MSKSMSTPSSLVIRTQNKYRSLTTTKPYRKGEIICEIPTESLYDAPNQFTVQIGIDQHVEVKELASMNHSCDPSAILDTTRMLVFATRDLAAGDELTFFYPSTEWEMSSPFICLCGAPSCIHVVAGARFLPLSTLENHFLNHHIRELMIQLLNKTEQHLTNLEREHKSRGISKKNPAVS